MIVRRKDYKEFKSGRKYNTVKEQVNHWKFDEPAYTFLEDDSCVVIRKVEEVNEREAKQYTKNLIEDIFRDRVSDVFKKYELVIGEDIENLYWCEQVSYGYSRKYNQIVFEMRRFTAEFLFDLAKALDTYQIYTTPGRQIDGCDTCGHGQDSFVRISLEFNPLTSTTESV